MDSIFANPTPPARRDCRFHPIVVCIALWLPAALLGQETVPEADLERVCAGKLTVFPLPPFELFDTNDDGVISIYEAAECGTLELMFSRLDVDANAALIPMEYDAFAELWQRRARSLGEDPSG